VKSALGSRWASALIVISVCQETKDNGRCTDEPSYEQITVTPLQFAATDFPKEITVAVRNIRWLDIQTSPHMCEEQHSPLALDTTGEGLKFSGPTSVMFDITGSGTPVPTGWIAGHGNGLLARDLNHNGFIDDGTELFGTATVMANGERAPDGFTALKELDDNGDGFITPADASYSTLLVWVDANHNAVSEPNELFTLRAMNITSINLNDLACTPAGDGSTTGCLIQTDKYGNTIKFQSIFDRLVRGQLDPRAIVDVWFNSHIGN